MTGTQEAVLHWVRPLVYPALYCLHWLTVFLQHFRQGSLPVMPGNASDQTWDPQIKCSPSLLTSLPLFLSLNYLGDLLGKYCGASIPSALDTSSNLAYIKFATDGSINAPGFRLHFSASVEGELQTVWFPFHMLPFDYCLLHAFGFVF